MSSAAPMMMIFVLLIGGIVAWGALTDWTFSGLLPRKGAKCTPDKDEKDENAKGYVYDEDEECTIISKCKKDWELDESNTKCTYSDKGEVCTPKGTPIINGKYTFDDDKICEYIGCNDGWKPGEDSKSCIDEWVLPTKTKLEKYQALGYPLRIDDDTEPVYKNSEKTTIKECREEAKKEDAVMFGLRAIGNTAQLGEKTCWYYTGDPIVTVEADEKISDIINLPNVPQANYWVECVDTEKSAKDFCTK